MPLAWSRSGCLRRPPPPPPRPNPLSACARDRTYAELEREAADIGPFVNVVKKVVKLVKPAVVHIEAEKHTTTEGGRRRVEESGSGVIVEMGGKPYAVTNRHVIRDTDASNIKIKLEDGRELTPSRIWSDPKTDVAVMALSGDRMASLRLGDSDRMEIGDFVIAVGSPFGLSHSVTLGIISARDRRNLALGNEGLKYQDFIQTDAAINPGNSGGPLINLRGEVIGINTAIATESGKNQGIGFAIPASMLRVVVQQLVERGQVQRAFLGVNLDARVRPRRRDPHRAPTPDWRPGPIDHAALAGRIGENPARRRNPPVQRQIGGRRQPPDQHGQPDAGQLRSPGPPLPRRQATQAHGKSRRPQQLLAGGVESPRPVGPECPSRVRKGGMRQPNSIS